MRLILASEGFTTPDIIAECVAMAGKPATELNLAVLNEAYAVAHGDHRWALANIAAAATAFGGRIELVNLLALTPEAIHERLEAADIIFTVGGHVDYLMSVLLKSGAAQLLPELLQDKVYVGSSAGSMVLGQRLPAGVIADIYGEDCGFGVSQYLGFVPFAVLPHLGHPHYPRNSAQQLPAILQDYARPVYAITDNSAIVLNNGSQYWLGDAPVVIPSIG